jgi:hypothetical protein
MAFRNQGIGGAERYKKGLLRIVAEWKTEVWMIRMKRQMPPSFFDIAVATVKDLYCIAQSLIRDIIHNSYVATHPGRVVINVLLLA